MRIEDVSTTADGGKATHVPTVAAANVVQCVRDTLRLTAVDENTIHWLLRIACFCEFVGHGAFGIITKPIWTSYFAVVGIPPSLAYLLMPVIGTIDITLGVLVLFRPFRAALLYMAFWGLLTASIRPLAGEPIWEWIERAPNWAVPLALLYLRNFGEVRGFFRRSCWRAALRTWLS